MYSIKTKLLIVSCVVTIFFGSSSFVFAQVESAVPNQTCGAGQILVDGACECAGDKTYIDGQCVTPPNLDPNYYLLAPFDTVDGGFKKFDPSEEKDGKNVAFGVYVNLMLKIFIGLCGVFAVIMIVMGGIEYMTSELISSKEGGRERITNALFGLLIALGAYALLNTINPELLRTDIEIDEVTLQYEDAPQVPSNGKYGNGTSVGAPWNDTTAGINATLPSGVEVCNSQGVCTPAIHCTSVGQPNCTSTRGLSTSALVRIKDGCKCSFQISGGTEWWLHGGATGSTSHGPGSPTVDLRTNNSALDKYLSGGQPLVVNKTYPNAEGPYYFEGNHWHVRY